MPMAKPNILISEYSFILENVAIGDFCIVSDDHGLQFYRLVFAAFRPLLMYPKLSPITCHLLLFWKSTTTGPFFIKVSVYDTGCCTIMKHLMID